MKKGYIVDKHGKETEVKGHKHKLRSQPGLQHLPSELVATDDDDPDKISIFDAPHIQKELIEEHDKRAQAPAKKNSKYPPVAQPGEYISLTQFQIDIVRLRVCKAVTDVHMEEVRQKAFKGIPSRYVWFPENNVNEYQLRMGNPPSDRDRPKHLKRFKLEIDPVVIPQTDTFQEILNDAKAAGTFDMGA